jgi:hypothetical protein
MARYTRRTTPWPENRREALCEWLRANGVDPDSIPQDADLYLEPAPEGDPYTGRYLHYEAFHLNSDGRRHVDERGHGAARERRRTPLLVDPPDWWEPYRSGRPDTRMLCARCRASWTATRHSRAASERWERVPVSCPD